MLGELRILRDEGYPKEFLNRYAVFRHEYSHLPVNVRMKVDFGYFLRCKYVEYLKQKIK